MTVGLGTSVGMQILSMCLRGHRRWSGDRQARARVARAPRRLAQAANVLRSTRARDGLRCMIERAACGRPQERDEEIRADRCRHGRFSASSPRIRAIKRVRNTRRADREQPVRRRGQSVPALSPADTIATVQHRTVQRASGGWRRSRAGDPARSIAAMTDAPQQIARTIQSSRSVNPLSTMDAFERHRECSRGHAAPRPTTHRDAPRSGLTDHAADQHDRDACRRSVRRARAPSREKIRMQQTPRRTALQDQMPVVASASSYSAT